MKIQVWAASALILLSVASAPAWAQRARATLPQPLHSPNPSLSLSAPTASPLQQQMREDDASSIRAQQRDLLQQNPSGTTRQELEIGHQLNGYGAPR